MLAEPTPDLFVYIMPKPSHWHGWINLSKTTVRSIFEGGESGWLASAIHDIEHLQHQVDRLLYRGRIRAEQTLGYQGDVAKGPYFSLVPSSPSHIPVVAWVSGERRLTFIASSVPMPHLEEFAEAAKKIRESDEEPEYDRFQDLIEGA